MLNSFLKLAVESFPEMLETTYLYIKNKIMAVCEGLAIRHLSPFPVCSVRKAIGQFFLQEIFS